MNIYFVERAYDDNIGCGEYERFVCVAESEQDAREIGPEGLRRAGGWGTDVTPESLRISFIGKADAGPPRVILASFNAG